MERKPPRTGLMILVVAIGAGAVGFFVGQFQGEEAVQARPQRPRTRLPGTVLLEPPAGSRLGGGEHGAPELDEPLVANGASDNEIPAPRDLLDSLRAHAATDTGQMILIGMVANAARLGPAALPEIRELLASGTDIQFSAYSGQGLGYPSLRVALLAAAEATGDPAATALIAEVAQTTESPVEVVFSAHLLDRLDALDAATAQRTLDSLRGVLTPEQRKAMGPVIGKVVPAAARADPAYAEAFLNNQLREAQGKGANPRFVAPILDGLPPDRARDLVLNTLTAGDITDRNKAMLASRAAQRELPLLREMRHAIESNAVSPRVASSIAHSALGGRSYSRMEKTARRALKKGDVGEARTIASRYRARIAETNKTVTAARNSGAKLRNDTGTRLRLYEQRLNALRGQIAKTLKKQPRAKKKKG